MKNVMRFTFCLLSLLFYMSAGAKVEKSELLGVWTQMETENGVTMMSTYDFKEDNTVTQLLMINGSAPKMNVMADAKAEYNLEDDCLTFKVNPADVNFTAFEIEGLPQEYVGMAQQQMLAELTNVVQKLTDLKIEGNILTAKFNGQKVTFKRN